MTREVLLLQPPALSRKGSAFQLFFPLGLAYLSSYLRLHVPCVSVHILDAVVEGISTRTDFLEQYELVGLTDDDLRLKIEQLQPWMVGITCMFTNQHFAALHAASLIKKIDPSILVVMGGAHATAVPDELLETGCVDVVVRGPGETTIADVINCLLAGGDLAKVGDGVAYRNNEGLIVVRPIRISDKPLDELPFPDYERVNLSKYFEHANALPIHPTYLPALPILTTRGCPHKCMFCYVSTAWGIKMLRRSVENVSAEIRLLRDRYGVEELMIMDDNFGFFKEYTMEFLDTAKALGVLKIVPFSGSTLASLCDPAFLDKQQELGVDYLRIFPESGSRETLKRMRKPHNLDMIERVIADAKRRELMIYAYFLIGFPWQTLDEMDDEVELASNFDVDFRSFSVLCALPGTDLYRDCKEKGFLAENVTYSDISLYSGNIATPNFSNLDVERIAKIAYISSNFLSEERVIRAARLFRTSADEMYARKLRAQQFLAEVETRLTKHT